jgi:acyl-CoA synthetase (AMP-forming)/AMP-acid ligase II
MSGCKTIGELLRYRANTLPEEVAYRFLSGNASEEPRIITFAALERRTRAVAATLRAHAQAGDRALLLYPPGLDFGEAFFACMVAGIVAVPTAIPLRPNDIERVLKIAADARPKLVLSVKALLPMLKQHVTRVADAGDVTWIATDALPETGGEDESMVSAGDADPIAFLQYTSGSTSDPKGVVVRHGNLMANAEMIQKTFRADEALHTVSWLPHSHDMGLIGTVLTPLYVGCGSTLLSPVTFLRNPRSWLEAISTYRAGTSGGPNFAYQMCVDRIRDADIGNLDLSSWRVAFVGAEPVRPETLSAFAEKFRSSGFSKKAFFPCYGLAEATLFVSGESLDREPLVFERASDSSGSAGGAPARMVSCGPVAPNSVVKIVNPESGIECAPGQEGEIWISGPHVADGYWNRPEESARVFQAELGGLRFLRTGDLGFLKDGELVISGRLKDMICLRGRNLYPQEIEATVETACPAVRRGRTVASSIWENNEEALCLIAELGEEAPSVDAIDTIREAIAERHGVAVARIAFLSRGSVLMTTSGKVCRGATRDAWISGRLTAEKVWPQPGTEARRQVA